MSVVRKLSQLIFISLLIITIYTSCTSSKRVTYFQDVRDSSVLKRISADYQEPVIQPDDILSITVQTIDPQNSAQLNQASSSTLLGASSASSIGTQTVSGYLVDKNGEVELPLIGRLKLAGLTTFQARELVRDSATHYFKSPSVQVRFANFKITLLGEVTRPATYTVPNEKVGILDVIGLAGDLTIYGRRDNVLLIRTTNAGKEFEYFDLTSSKIFKSPNYYLKQNDIIYVEPNKAKIATTDSNTTRSITIGVSLLSAVLFLLIRISR